MPRFISALIAIILMMTTAVSAEPFARYAGVVRSPSVIAGQTGVRDIWQCTPAQRAAYLASGLPRGDSLATMQAIDQRVRSTIRYREDREEAWTNFVDQALSRTRAVGDCEDYALTVITMALCADVPAEKLGIALSSQNDRNAATFGIDHVFAYYTQGGRTYSVGNTTRNRVVQVAPRDRVKLWQSVPGLRVAPGDFVPAIPVAR